MAKGGGVRMNDELYLKMLKEKGIQVPGSQVISGSGKKGPYDLSDAQRGIWFLQQLHPGSTAFSNGTAIRIEGKLAVDSVQMALRNIVNRHEILNINITTDQGIPRAVPQGRSLEFTYRVLDEENIPANEPSLLATIRELISPCVNLAHDPLLSCTLLRVHEEEHVLVIAMHHIVSDGWSKSVLVQEFLQLYGEAEMNRPSGLQPLTLQYRDYVDWLQTPEHTSQVEEGLQYWLSKLEDAPPLLELPADYRRGSVQSGQGGLESFELDEVTYQKVQQFCRRERITVFTFFLTIFKILLFRYTSSEDILVGTPVAGRSKTELEQLIGMFVNPIVIRTKPHGQMLFTEYLRVVHSELLQAFKHQEVPFDRIVEKLNPVREQSYHPVFQTMFQMDNIPHPRMELEHIRLSVISLDSGFAQNDLTVSCWEQDDTLKGTFEFSADLFSRGNIRWFIACYVQLICSVLDHKDQSLDAYPILDPAHENLVLNEWTKGKVFQVKQAFQQRIEQMLKDSSAACAILEGDREISYGELDVMLRRMTSLLAQNGSVAGMTVAVCLPSSAQFVAACLAVSCSGGVVVPLDPDQPAERIHSILNELGGTYVIVSDSRYVQQLTLPVERCILVGRELELTRSDENSLSGACPHHPSELAFIVFTSGTTGIPKGVMLENGSIDNLVDSFITSYDVNRTDRMLPVTSVASSSFIGEFLPILAAGGTLVLPDKETVLQPVQLQKYMEKHGVSILSTVPSMLKRLNDTGSPPATLRLILSGGENLLPTQVDQMKNISIVNGYGLSESGVCSTYSYMQWDESGLHGAASLLGKPVANQQVYVLDENLRPVPPGVRGQICVSGHGLARGYLNHPQLTHQKFRNHPYISGERLLLTGDYGCWTSGGELTFAGREDRQIQIRGYRMELDEVEKHLNACHQVAEAVVHAVPDSEGTLQVIAYYTVQDEQQIASEQLSAWLDTRIPSYMKPGAYIELEQIPWNLNGKLNTSALPRPDALLASRVVAYERPVTVTEKKIARAWAEVLHTAEFGVNDNFFDLGGHSLLLAQVLDLLNPQFEERLTLISLFKYSTVRSLAAYLNKETEEPSVTRVLDVAEKQKNAFRRYRQNPSILANVSIEKEGGR